MYALDNDSGVQIMPDIKAQQFNANEPRWFTEGGNGVAPSYPGADWFNIVQSELLAVLTAGNITPNKTELNQLTLAIQSIINQSLANQFDPSELVGSVSFFATTTAPKGWLKANGAAVSRTTYAALFARIGTTFGAGDGRSTFNLPDLRGEFIRGLDDGRNIDSNRRLGSSQGDAIRNITGTVDSITDNGNAWGAFATSNNAKTKQAVDWNASGNHAFNFDASRVVPTANENRPRNIALLACIKY